MFGWWSDPPWSEGLRDGGNMEMFGKWKRATCETLFKWLLQERVLSKITHKIHKSS